MRSPIEIDGSLGRGKAIVDSRSVTFQRRRATPLAMMTSLTMVVAASTAGAQSAQIDLNQFRPAELSTDGFALSTPDGQGHLRFGFSVWLDNSDDPFLVTGVSGNELKVVRQQFTGHLTWSLGLWDHLVVFMDLPYHFIIRAGDGVAADLPMELDPLLPSGGSLGDLYLGARGNLYGTRDDVFQLGLQATMTVNTASAAGSDQRFAGQVDRSPHLGGWFEVLVSFNPGDVVRIPLMAGYKLSTRTVQVTPDLSVGNEWTFGGGLQLLFASDQFMLTAEAFGRAAANAQPRGRVTTPVEILGGFKWLPKFGFTLGVGGTAGLTDGYGAPDWRLIGTLGYTMPGEEAPSDADGDGVSDALDRCPNEPEDKDGFEDADGCPDLDNDGDGVPDDADGCPNDAEDVDGFVDEDGCPELDNDGDGITDIDDACPDEPGPAENNGCPDLDRDGDGVPDRIDNCPREPGTLENRGCQAKQLVVIGDDQLEILEKVYFRKGSAKLQKRSWALLDNVAAVLRAHPEIERVRVEGHSDATGSLAFNMRLSKRRAETVVRYLVGRGKVSRSRLVAEGYGPTQPLVENAKSKEELALNRRVEFHIAKRDADD